MAASAGQQDGQRITLRAFWPMFVGMAVAGAAAVVASASTLAELAREAGWVAWTPWLLPAALDVAGAVGGWCWLRPGAPGRARAFGRVVAVVGAVGTLVGNAAGHLVASGYLEPGPVLVVVVGAVPPAVLVALAHLTALLTADEQPRAVEAAPVVAPRASVPAEPPVAPGAAGAVPARPVPARPRAVAAAGTDRAVVVAQVAQRIRDGREPGVRELAREHGKSPNWASGVVRDARTRAEQDQDGEQPADDEERAA
jgi:hypothetical protein